MWACRKFSFGHKVVKVWKRGELMLLRRPEL
jgi:hypothetical protein